MSNDAKYICDDCGYSTNNPVAFALHPCRPSNGVNWNSRMPGGNGHRAIIAAIVALFIVGFVNWNSGVVKAQTVPQPQPTPSVGTPPQMPRVWLPYIATSETVHGCDDCGDSVTGQGRYWGGQ